MFLHNLRSKNKKMKKRRVGRGIAAGRGKTCGRGTKGQKSRSGAKIPASFEGGQMPLVMRLPKKRGFKNLFRKQYQIINVGFLNRFKDGSKVTVADLFKNNLIARPEDLVKVLGNGDLKKKLEVEADAFSKKAVEKINQAGGKIILRSVPKFPSESNKSKLKIKGEK